MTGQELKKLLDDANMTQVNMAKSIGISDRNMRRYVSGVLPVPEVVEIAVRCLTTHSQVGKVGRQISLTGVSPASRSKDSNRKSKKVSK